MRNQYYKQQYSIGFYDTNDMLVRTFDNIKEICGYLGKQINRANTQYIKLALYRALKRDNHITYLLGSKMKVYIFDINDD